MFASRFGQGAARPSIFMPRGVPGAWHLDLADEFNGPANAAPDPSIWTYWLQNQTRNSAINRAENTFLDGSGNLCLRITNTDIGHGAELSAGGLITTRHDFGFVEEFLECSLSAHGWCTFWRQSTESGTGMSGLNTPPDPPDGAEYDIVEQFGGDANPIQHNIHWGGYGANHTTTGQNISVADKTAFNVFGMWFSPINNWVKFYVNGALDYTFTTILSTRTDNEARLTVETNGDVTSALAKVGYFRRWVQS